jgi:hypothetical protein
MQTTRKSVKQARSRAEASAWTTQRIIHALDALDLIDHRFIDHCKSMREELVPALLQAMDESDGIAKLNAGLLLLHLGETDGTVGIIECLRSNDPSLHAKTLFGLSILPLESVHEQSPFWKEPPVPINAEQLFLELKPLLTQPDTQVGNLALQVVTKLNLPEVDKYLRPLLRYPSRKVQTNLLNRWFARRQENHDALEVAEELLFGSEADPNENYWVVAALEKYCRGNKPELAKYAAALLARFVSGTVDYPGNTMTNLISRALSGLKAARYPEEAAILESVLGSSVKDWRRGAALERLAELDGMARADQLIDALSDRTLRSFAANGIAKIAAGSNNHRLIEALCSALKNEDRDGVKRTLTDAVITVGGKNVTVALEQISGQLTPDAAMRVFWLQNNLTPQQAIERLVQAGAIPIPDQDLIHKIDAQWRQNQRPLSVIFSLLFGVNRLVWFDCETSRLHPDYVGLMEDLAEISREVFLMQFISQRVNPATDESEIMFVVGDRAYSFTARDFGDWYDVEFVIKGLNAALIDSGSRERFIALFTGDQTSSITFAPEVMFRQAARELGLPLEADYQASMKAGVAFEQYVRTKLEDA